MPLDPYSPCPCGCGKKLKFCCSKDILPELEKLIRTIAADQSASAQEQVTALVATHGARPSLMTIKAELELNARAVDKAKVTIGELLKVAPYNPNASALAAMLAAFHADLNGMIEKLQRALEYVDTTVSSTIYSAIALAANLLLSKGRVAAARAHLELQARLTNGEDPEPLKALDQLYRAPFWSAFLKADITPEEAPRDTAWAGEFRAAMASAGRGAWLACCESLGSLADKVGDHPAIIENIAIMHTWLGQQELACEAWKKVAEHPEIPDEKRLHATVLTLLFSPETKTEIVPNVKLIYPVTDTDRLTEALLSDKRVEQTNLQRDDVKDEPPPKGTFALLDRPVPDYDESMTRDQIPVSFGELRLFGRQTDREARLEFESVKNSNLERAKEILAEITAPFVGNPTEEVSDDGLPIDDEALSIRWFLPRNTPTDRQTSWRREQQRVLILNRWPELPHHGLDGKRPSEVAGDPAYRMRLEAAIISIEESVDWGSEDFDCNELRANLGLPLSKPLAGEGLSIASLSVIQLARLDASSLSDEQLVEAFKRAVTLSMKGPVRRFATEIESRDLGEDAIPREAVYRMWVESAHTLDDCARVLVNARKWSVKHGRSPASWLLIELQIRIRLGHLEDANWILQTLRSRHLKEPGIGEGLYQLLTGLGIVQPDSLPGRPPGAASLPPDAAAPPEPGKLWTPDQASASGEQKSKLWVPD